MLFAIALFTFLFLIPHQIEAIYNPLSVPNNKYGIHLADTNDIADAAQLVNSNKGAWGYITLVIQDNDLNKDKWQNIFNDLRRKQLIPIVRIATHVEKDYWLKPEEHNISKWVDFLSSLNWPIENKYVIIFNEPNHAKEWGNTVDPKGYADILIKFSQTLKNASQDFFILPAGLDASAPNGFETESEEQFIRDMITTKPDVFTFIDGWTSHSYPNPNFSGNPYAYGKGTLATFLWEKNLLRSYGVTKDLPVFITETGWQHAYGKTYVPQYLSPETVANYQSIAVQTIWQDPQIVAITPFVFNYQDYPFDHFSFKQLDSSDFYPQYIQYKNIEKIPGKPKQVELISLEKPFLPDTLIMQSTYSIETTIKNIGQSIFNPYEYELILSTDKNTFQWLCDPVPPIEPFEKATIRCGIKTPLLEGAYDVDIFIKHGEHTIPIESKRIRVIPPPSAQATVQFAIKPKFTNTVQATVLVYNNKDELLHKFTDIQIEKSKFQITGLYNMLPGQQYRIVVLVPYYLPRQTIITFLDGGNIWRFNKLYPFDFNRDGKFSWADIWSVIKMSPFQVLKILF